MEEKTLSFYDAPMGYPLCFNNDCALRGQCMHYHMGQLAPEQLTTGPAIYPAAWKNGVCSHFASTEKVRFAWGFDGLFKNLPQRKANEARRALRQFFSSGMSTYYRFHNGERLLSPARQREILDFMAQYGNTDEMQFDHYVEQYDFS